MSTKRTPKTPRAGWAGVYKNRRTLKYSAMCYVPGPRKHVHLGSFSDPRLAAVLHDAALVSSGRTPENCDDDQYATTLLSLCKPEKERGQQAVLKFAENLRSVPRSKAVPSMRSFRVLVNTFLADRGKPPPTRPYKSRVKLSTSNSPSSGQTKDSSGTPLAETTKKRASESPPEVVQVKRIRPSGARKALIPTFEEAVDCASKPEEPTTSWLEYCEQNEINAIDSIIFDPDMKDDEHVASWRDDLMQMSFSPQMKKLVAI
jgi:hypothetical protein